MSEEKKMVTVNVHVEVTAETLETIVEHARNITGKDEKGHYRVDTADMTGALIGSFLEDMDFESYVKELEFTSGEEG